MASFDLQTLVLSRYRDKLLRRLRSQSQPASPELLTLFSNHVIAQENKASTFTPDGLRRVERDGVRFRTYEERDKLGLVTLNVIGRQEEGGTASAVHGVFELANLVARHGGFDPPVERRYVYAPRVASGVLDVGARLEGEGDEREGGKVQEERETTLGAEWKYKITWRDWVVLVWVLSKGKLTVTVHKEGKVDVRGGSHVKWVGKAMQSILAQVGPCRVSRSSRGGP